MMRHSIALGLLLISLVLPQFVFADDDNPGASAPSAAPRARAASDAAPREAPRRAPEPALPADSVTTRTIKVGGHDLTYTAHAGTLALTDDKGEKSAEIFYVAYTLNGADASRRPITFAFNGGPGAGSAFLQLGAIGPRVLDVGDGLKPPFGNGAIIDNPDTWLDFTDLVFIDPVGTGYSRATIRKEDIAKQFWGIRQDLDSLGTVVRLALARLDRFSSPVYLAGESYGGYRAARLPWRLANNEGVSIRGAVMVSPVLESGLIQGGQLSLLSWALRLPSYAAVNLAGQGKLTPDALRDVEHFALGDYIRFLAAPIGDAKKNADIYKTISDFIGLPEETVARWGGRIPLGIFVKADRHDQGEVVSRYDGSFAGGDPYPSAYNAQGGDPILDGLKAPLTTAFVAYARNELNFKTDRRYELLNDEVARKWQWRNPDGSSNLNASDDLRKALALDPRLKVMIAHGMTDLQTPYFSSRYVIDHLPAALTRNRVSLPLYQGGHMMYLRPKSRAALHDDAKALFAPAP